MFLPLALNLRSGWCDSQPVSSRLQVQNNPLVLPNRSQSTQTSEGEERPWQEGMGGAHCLLQCGFKRRVKLSFMKGDAWGKYLESTEHLQLNPNYSKFSPIAAGLWITVC